MRRLIILGLVAFGASEASAMASGSVVFDPSNFIKNTLTAAATVKTEVSTAATALQTLKQLQEMIRQAQALSRGNLDAIGSFTGQKELTSAIRDAQGLYDNMKNLDMNLSNIQGRYDYLQNMSSKYGLSMEQYLEQRNKLAQEGVKAAQYEQERDLAVLKRTKSAIETVKSLQSNSVDTNTASFMKMNENLAAVNTSIATLVESTTLQNMAKTQADAKVRADKMAAENDANKHRSDQAAISKNAYKQVEAANAATVARLPGRE